MSAYDRCSECGAPASHTTYWPDGMVRYACCTCYVKAGNPPADWHVGCMKEWNRQQEGTQEALHFEGGTDG